MSSDTVIIDALKALGWHVNADEKSVSRAFEFESFETAFGLMTRLASVAERLNHHPDWRNTYNRVWITLTTHDLGGLSTLDLEFARACDAALKSMEAWREIE